MTDVSLVIRSRWIGPFKLRDYLERSIDPAQIWPPEAAGVYVVSCNTWIDEPNSENRILYVGSNPKNPTQLRNRIGFLIKDMLGFWGDKHGSHSGGQSLWNWCFENQVHPLELYVGWIIDIECGRCTETELFARFRPLLSRKAPARCKGHEDCKSG